MMTTCGRVPIGVMASIVSVTAAPFAGMIQTGSTGMISAALH
jgi:hypothetical protein